MTLQGQINGIYKITRKETGEHTQRITKRQWVDPSSSLARVFNLPSQPGQIHHPCIAHHEYRTPPQFSYSPVFQINHSCLRLTCNQICLVQSHQESGCEGYIYLRPGTSRHFPRNSRSRPSFTHSRYFFFFWATMVHRKQTNFCQTMTFYGCCWFIFAVEALP